MTTNNKESPHILDTAGPASDEGLDERDYVTPKEFVRLTGLSLSTVRRYLADGRLPKYQPGGPRCRVQIPRIAIEIPQDLERRPEDHDAAAPVDAPHSPDPSSPPPPQHRGPAPRWTGRR